jgi:hypothetical protein
VLLSSSSPTAPPSLVGIRLSDGSVETSVPLPFVNGGPDEVGHLALNTAATPTLAVVGGLDAWGNHIFGTLAAASNSSSSGGSYRQFANLSAAWNDVGSCTTVYIPATNEVLVQFDANTAAARAAGSGSRNAPAAAPAAARAFEISVYAVSLANGSVRVLTEDMAQGRDVQTLGGFDAVTSHVFGLGFDSTTGLRELVDLDPVALSLRVVGGNISINAVALNGMTAFDDARRSLFWVGDRTGADPFFLEETSVADGRELSRRPLCSTDDCPMSLAYYPGSA